MQMMHWIVYNTIRLLMLEAADESNIKPRQISFKASMQALRQWEPQLNRAELTHSKRSRLITLLRASIADAKLSHRPGRREPRCVKRRPKPFVLLVRHRLDMIDIPHKNRYRAEHP